MHRSQRTIGNEVAYRYQGFAARATYDYENKYLFEANVGINGSENFSKAHRYGCISVILYRMGANRKNVL